LKWELEVNSETKMQPLHLSLSNAFKKLNYKQPELEASLILLYIDGIASSMLKGSNIDVNNMVKFILAKYEL